MSKKIIQSKLEKLIFDFGRLNYSASLSVCDSSNTIILSFKDVFLSSVVVSDIVSLGYPFSIVFLDGVIKFYFIYDTA